MRFVDDVVPGRGAQVRPPNETEMKATMVLRVPIEEASAKVTHGVLPVIMMGPTHAKQLFQNLIGNAIKFTETGIIQVNASRSEQLVNIEIVDTGIGIPPDKYDLLFEPFQHFDETRQIIFMLNFHIHFHEMFLQLYDGI